ncbi:MAG TPA: GNAT family N-acetyltransferase, partial [Acidimicrobiales bacterium]
MEIRAITEDELPRFVRADGIGFGLVSTEENITDAERVLELDRTVAVFDGDDMVGTAAAFTFELTLPGLSTLPAAGVTWVSVLPTHRRQGVLRRIMEFQLDDVVRRGEPLAVLTASEGGIYERFGYGAATFNYNLEADPGAVVWRDVLPDSGRVRLVDAEEARKALPPVFDRVRRARPGDHQRDDSMWDYWFQDKEKWRNGMSARFYAVHETASGEVDGFAAYRRTTG